ncbi:hypothetical protein [Vibrio bathopelagicus]|nr:hypothetical protein [Vibrio bathopelagicus]
MKLFVEPECEGTSLNRQISFKRVTTCFKTEGLREAIERKNENGKQIKRA